jgi:hypothetical protein
MKAQVATMSALTAEAPRTPKRRAAARATTVYALAAGVRHPPKSQKESVT